jgi:peptide/nickel transport system substrate-binding protein
MTTNPQPFRCAAALALVALAVACSGGGEKSAPVPAGDKASTPGSVAAGPGTPNPPFQGEAPKGAARELDAEPGRYGGRLVIATAGNPKSFNPVLANETSTTEITNGPMFSSCWGFNNKAQTEQPGLCEKYERSQDGLTWTFTLREGLQWSDGTPLTTDDFEFTYAVMLDAKVPNSTKDLFKQGKDAAGVEQFAKFEKVDARSFRFVLREVNVIFQYAVGSIYAIPKHKWESQWQAGEFTRVLTLQTPPAEVVTSGPFRLKQFDTEQRVVLERNPHYWKVDKVGNRLPYLDQVIFVIVPDYNAAFLKFRQGETHLHEVRPDEIDLLKRELEKSDFVLSELGASFNTNYIMFNLDTGNDKDGKPFVDPIKMKWFQNKLFRKAVSHAIDRESIVRTVFHGQGQPHYGYTSPANKAWYSDAVVKYPYNLETSKKLLAEGGFASKDDGLYDAQGNRVSFRLVTNSENPTRVALLNLLKEDFKKLGMEVNIQPVPFNDLVTALNDTRNFEAVVLGWASGVPPDPSQMKNVLLSSGRSHNWFPNQKKPATPWEAQIDDLMQKNSQALDPAERTRTYNEIERIFSDELPQIGIVVAMDYAAARKTVGNFKPAGLRPKTHWNIDQLFLNAAP